VLQVGDPVPEARVQRAPGEELPLADLVRDGPVLLVFYLFDWSST
jgi:peroxiredoxin